jgi:hypothetical protein
MTRNRFLHATGRQPVTGDIDDVVGARHDEQVAVIIDETGIRCFVVAGKLGEIGIAEPVFGVPQRRQAARRQRQLDNNISQGPGRDRMPGIVDHLHVIPGIGTAGEPCLIGSKPSPIGLPAMVQPVSVCHQ